MAQVPVVPSPSVAPSAAPTPFQQITPPAEAFGGTVAGQVASAFGKSASDTGNVLNDYAVKVQALTNQNVATKNAMDAAQQAGQAFSDWKANHTEGAAVATYPAFQQTLNDIFTKGQEGLSPLATQMYNETARRYITSYNTEAAGYAADQGHAGLVNGFKTSNQQAGQIYVGTPPTPGSDSAFITTVTHNVMGYLASTGITDPNDPRVHQEVINNTSPAFLTQAKAMIDAQDTAGAQKFFDTHKSMMTLEAQDQVLGALRASSAANNVLGDAAAVINGGTPSGGAGDIHSAIHFQESGNNPNVRESAAGAKGIGQITQGTWNTWQREGLVHPGEDINNPTDNLAVSNRAIDMYRQQYNGDNARVAVAYYSGPQNVAPAGSATPWVHDYSGAQTHGGPSVSAYVQQVLGRMQGGGAPTGGTSLTAGFKPGADVDVQLAQARSAVDSRIDAQPWDEQHKEQVRQAAYRQIGDAADILDKTQQGLYHQVDEWVQQHPNADPAAVQSAWAGQWGELPAKYQQAVESHATFQANLPTDARNNNYSALLGRVRDPSQPVPASDILTADLTYGQRKQLLDMNSVPHPDNAVEAIMKPGGQGDAAVRSLGIGTPDPSTHQRDPPYYQFRGFLQEEVDNFRAQNNGQPPTSAKDIGDIIARATAQTSQNYHYVVPGTDIPLSGRMTDASGPARFSVPSADHAQIVQAFARQHPGETPTEEEIGRLYALQLRRTGALR